MNDRASLRFDRLRFHMRSEGMLHFPGPLPANVLRGALGSVLMRHPVAYARTFAPASKHGPSGLAQPPRPFVFRAAHLTDQTIAPGHEFSFDLHVFGRESVPDLVSAFLQVSQEGLGPSRSPVLLLEVAQVSMELKLQPTQTAQSVSITFVTPTELKSDGEVVAEPVFSVLISLILPRLQNLFAMPRNQLGAGWFDRAAEIKIVESNLQHIRATRFSTRTGERHPLGGFTGTVVYTGDLTAFVPFLEAAQYTGVGRQTTWGKGELRMTL